MTFAVCAAVAVAWFWVAARAWKKDEPVTPDLYASAAGTVGALMLLQAIASLF